MKSLKTVAALALTSVSFAEAPKVSGFYAGINLGLAKTNSKHKSNLKNEDKISKDSKDAGKTKKDTGNRGSTGGVFGIFAGYDHMVSDCGFIGAEAGIFADTTKPKALKYEPAGTTAVAPAAALAKAAKPAAPATSGADQNLPAVPSEAAKKAKAAAPESDASADMMEPAPIAEPKPVVQPSSLKAENSEPDADSNVADSKALESPVSDAELKAPDAVMMESAPKVESEPAQMSRIDMEEGMESDADSEVADGEAPKSDIPAKADSEAPESPVSDAELKAPDADMVKSAPIAEPAPLSKRLISSNEDDDLDGDANVSAQTPKAEGFDPAKNHDAGMEAKHAKKAPESAAPEAGASKVETEKPAEPEMPAAPKAPGAAEAKAAPAAEKAPAAPKAPGEAEVKAAPAAEKAPVPESAKDSKPQSVELKRKFAGGITLRAGYFINSKVALVGTLGLELDKWDAKVDGKTIKTKTKFHVVPGVGIEANVAQNMTLGLHYKYVPPFKLAKEINGKISQHRVEARLAYKF